MSGVEVASFAASIASVAIACIAIWLSVHFYKMSTEQNKDASDAAKDIASSVDKLEKLFDKLYEGTFGMVKDTYADMRKQMWPKTTHDDQPKLGESKVDDRLSDIRAEVKQQMSEVMSRQSVSADQTKVISEKLDSLMTKAIEDTRTAEVTARRDNAIKKIRTIKALFIRNGMRYITAHELLSEVGDATTFFDAIEELRAQGGVRFDNPIGPQTSIMLLHEGDSGGPASAATS